MLSADKIVVYILSLTNLILSCQTHPFNHIWDEFGDNSDGFGGFWGQSGIQSDNIGTDRHARAAPNSIYEDRSQCLNKNPKAGRIDTRARVERLREVLIRNSFDAILIPSTDQHQNEYVAPSDRRLEYITGFSGSNGLAVITARGSSQILFTDSRYPLQADAQMDCNWKIIIYGEGKPSPSKWLTDNLSAGDKVAADARLFGFQSWTKREKNLKNSNISLLDSEHIFDKLWEEDGRPEAKNDPIFIHDLKYAGKTWQNKTSEIRAELRTKEADLFIVTSLDEVSWLFNLRGNDFPYSPVFYSYAALEASENGTAWLFVRNASHLTSDVTKYLTDQQCHISSTNCVEVLPYSQFGRFLQNQTRRTEVKKILLSKAHPYYQGVSHYIYSAVPEDKRLEDVSPILLAKAQKNPVEVEVANRAHLEDSASLIKFFAFLEKEITNSTRVWNEYSAAERLTEIRAQNANYKSDSFEAISAFGANGASAHYTPSTESAKNITNESLYLLDSGGQYFGGTTDVTRTVHFGTPTAFQIECYTRVLLGVLDVTSLIFPDKMRENFIDILARRPLLEIGLEYGHGSGHGIGSYLLVHEGPTLISFSTKFMSPVEEDYYFSVEPGYYEPGEFGIRIENIVHVIEAKNMSAKAKRKMLAFETVTLVPYERKLMDMRLFSRKQCDAVNAYHREIREKVGPLLQDDPEATEWMHTKTEPISCS